ncbi:MAG: hypothetical protein PHF86_03680 [Candidatus Nanoarchaeia archaeon]|nr:hypothetical protein [Candidatus Nanoarchaeia archaeon]
MTLNSIKQKILPCALSLAILGSTFMPFNNIKAYAQNTPKTQIEQVQTVNNNIYFRAPGNRTINGGTYNYKNIDETYPDPEIKGKIHFNEENSILGPITYSDNQVGFGVGKAPITYAQNNGCSLGSVLLEYEDINNDSKKELKSFSTGSLNGNRTLINVPEQVNPNNDLFAGVYCTYLNQDNTPNYTEVLASYPVNESTISYGTIPNNIPQDNTPRQNSIPRNVKPKTQVPRVTQPIVVQPSTNSNTNNEYHLRTSCGEVLAMLGKSPAKFGQVTLDNPKECNVYLDENNNTINTYHIEPRQNEGNVLNALTVDKKTIKLDFKADGTYSVVVGTTNYPNEKDILQFNVNKTVSLPVTQGTQNEQTNVNPNLISWSDLYPGTDGLNVKVRVKPFLRPRVNATENSVYKGQVSLNDILKQTGNTRVPYITVHQGNNLEFIVQDSDNLTYEPKLFQIKNIGKEGLSVEEVKLKKVLGSTYKIDEKGSNESVDNKKVVFPYNFRRVGSYTELAGNEYLLVLTGYDENHKKKDLDRIIIEVNNNPYREQLKGFLVGAGLGYGLGAVDAVNGGGLFTIGPESTTDVILGGTKTGGNIPQ